MLSASSTAMDMVKFIPGMQVDLFRNISLEGNSNIIILIDGVKRDAGFLSQLDSDRIDRIEIKDNPGAQYNGNIAGVVNIILKEDRKTGASGHVYAELPLKPGEILAFPSYSFNYMRNKLNAYTSYNGEYSYFNIESVNRKEIYKESFNSKMNKVENIYQKNWSHKFHYGMDYTINKKNLLVIYGFVNPHSSEFDGSVQLNTIAKDSVTSSWKAAREETDQNFSGFNSLYYKHSFNQQGAELAIELNLYNFKARHYSELMPEDASAPLLNHSKPAQNMLTGKVDAIIPINSTIAIETGFRESIKILSDQDWEDFNYTEMIGASYASFNYGGERFQLKTGMRIEFSLLQLDESHKSRSVHTLPSFFCKI